MTKRALITGITGQDGSYLAQLLLDKGYKVFGTYRKSAAPNFWRLQYLDILEKVTLVCADLTDFSAMFEAINACQPHEVYNLAAQSFPGASFHHPVTYGEITGLGFTGLVETIRNVNPKIKVFQASTIELYGKGDIKPLMEDTSFSPTNPYAVAKLYAYWIANIYRNGYGIYICNGIMFNHESPLRSLNFVTRKITNAVAKISLGMESGLELGNIDAKRDWGFAPEYVMAMWLMLQQQEPDDYIIATNEVHTVKDFVEKAFSIVGLDWSKYVRIDKKLIRPTDVTFLQGDYSKAKKKLGWQPKVRFDQLVEIMVNEDLQRWKRWSSGERFLWDAPGYPTR